MIKSLFGSLFGGNKVKNISGSELEKLMKKRDSVVLDVRTSMEFAQGHIPGAKLIDIRSKEFKEKIANLDKEKSYYVYCQSGMRSKKACRHLLKQDFKKVWNLSGGVKGWGGNLKTSKIMQMPKSSHQ